jgi:hypothetical protein
MKLLYVEPGLCVNLSQVVRICVDGTWNEPTRIVAVDVQGACYNLVDFGPFAESPSLHALIRGAYSAIIADLTDPTKTVVDPEMVFNRVKAKAREYGEIPGLVENRKRD